MSTLRRRLLLTSSALAGLLLATGCTSAPGGSPAPTSSAADPAAERLGAIAPAAPPEGRVLGVNMVIDVAGDAKLCDGQIMESYPPQCDGIPLDDWTWEGLDGSETSGDTRWGSYAVYGIYDGERLALTDEPIMMALFDPIAPEDPTGGVEGKTSEADLTRIQDDLAARLGTDALGFSIREGYVWVDVAWDDGTWQQAADKEFGDGVVIVASQLREVD
ncbi:hypothetical protein [Microbacterium sp. LWH12-1.2]|uniref:hypothetical protein n=1 Tax=Microbacterium sp. LWH12-1.2 TaxID=3135259 RepID=UPI00341C6A04